MKKWITIALLTLPTKSIAWDHKDTALQATYTIAHVLDWGQTRHLARHPTTHAETNKLLGKHPSPGQVDRYFATTLLLHTTIAYLLPSEARSVFQLITIGIEGGVVKRNYSLGVHATF